MGEPRKLLHAFHNRSDAETLVRIARSRPIPLDISDGGDYQTEGFILKTPASGIPARDGNVCGQADCVPYFLDEETGELIEQKDDNDQPAEWPVFNVFQAGAVSGDTFILAKLVYGVLVVDAEDCS